MRKHASSRIALCLGHLVIAALVAGCGGSAPGDGETPAEAAREALGVQAPGGTDRTLETQRKVDVIEETTVVDRETGEVITTEKEVTPVTVTKEKQIETDVDVNVGDTVKTVE